MTASHKLVTIVGLPQKQLITRSPSASMPARHHAVHQCQRDTLSPIARLQRIHGERIEHVDSCRKTRFHGEGCFNNPEQHLYRLFQHRNVRCATDEYADPDPL